MKGSAQPLGGVGRGVVGQLGLASALGMAATAVFQVLTVRGLGPSEYGVFAAFLAIINVVSIGSTALRNSVAVETVHAAENPLRVQAARHRDGSLTQGLWLGGVGAVVGVAVAQVVTHAVAKHPWESVVLAVAIPAYFLFARAQGLLQGSGRPASVAWWTTGAQLGQLVLAAVALLFGGASLTVLLAMVGATLVCLWGAQRQADRDEIPRPARAFTYTGVVVLGISLLSAWLSNGDVLLVRSAAADVVAGSFAAASMMIKTTYVIPTTLSLVLLPRFARRGDVGSNARSGVNVALAISAATCAAMFAVVWLFGEPLVHLLFGPKYDLTVHYLPAVAMMCIPWALAQTVLIRLTAIASRPTLALLVLAAAIQWGGGLLVLPNVDQLIVLNGCVGLVVFMGGWVLHRLTSRNQLAGV